MLSQSGMLTCFSALMLLEELLACKRSATTVPKSLLLGTGLTWSNPTRSNSGNVGQLNKNPVCVFHVDPIQRLGHVHMYSFAFSAIGWQYCTGALSDGTVNLYG